MAISLKDAKIVEMNRFLDEMEKAASVGHAAFEKAFNSPPSGLSVHEINTRRA